MFLRYSIILCLSLAMTMVSFSSMAAASRDAAGGYGGGERDSDDSDGEFEARMLSPAARELQLARRKAARVRQLVELIASIHPRLEVNMRAMAVLIAAQRRGEAVDPAVRVRLSQEHTELIARLNLAQREMETLRGGRAARVDGGRALARRASTASSQSISDAEDDAGDVTRRA